MKWLPDKRDIYFFLDRIGLSRKELMGILVLLSLIIGLELFRLIYPMIEEKPIYDYSEIEKKAQERAALMQFKYDSLMKYQYAPTEESIQELKSIKENAKKDVKKSSKTPKSKKEIPVIDINEASVSDWVQLPGIGEKTAQAIVDYRLMNGNFSKIDDLKKVKGIGVKKLEQIKAYLKL